MTWDNIRPSQENTESLVSMFERIEQGQRKARLVELLRERNARIKRIRGD